MVLGCSVCPWEAGHGHTLPAPLITCFPRSTAGKKAGGGPGGEVSVLGLGELRTLGLQQQQGHRWTSSLRVKSSPLGTHMLGWGEVGGGGAALSPGAVAPRAKVPPSPWVF